MLASFTVLCLIIMTIEVTVVAVVSVMMKQKAIQAMIKIDNKRKTHTKSSNSLPNSMGILESAMHLTSTNM